ncbi:thioesterase family protein [Aspergillus stella-maris]|uniref:thioesterase family protein n=1 Tax=Aspergillus stella-maris TaxID=1810926 RepID=UPI003CCCC427
MPLPPKEHASLTEATSLSSLTPDKGSSSRFEARISRDWCTQHSVLGGYITTLLLSAARRSISLNLGDARVESEAKYADPINVFTQFLRVVPPGGVLIECKILRTTSRSCVVQAELSLDADREKEQEQQQGPHQPPLSPHPKPIQEGPACIAIATFANLDNETGLTQTPTISPNTSAYKPPNRQTECVPIDDPVVDATPVTRKLNWVAPCSRDGLWGHRLGGHQREVWLSFRDVERISELGYLALLSDMPLQPPATHSAGFYNSHALSTLCQSVEFKKRPGPNTRWVLVRSNSQRVVNGRYDLNAQILDEEGDILALSHHVVFIMDLDRRTGKESGRSARI